VNEHDIDVAVGVDEKLHGVTSVFVLPFIVTDTVAGSNPVPVITKSDPINEPVFVLTENTLALIWNGMALVAPTSLNWRDS
jgi:hypothetical protein